MNSKALINTNKENMSDIKLMIKHIKLMYINNDTVLNSISNIHLLYDALHDLDEIVGIIDIKNSIIQIIKFLLVNCESTSSNKFDNHMLHTVVAGPPGVGKTSVGCILAKIWVALGLVKKKEPVQFQANMNSFNTFLERKFVGKITTENTHQKDREWMVRYNRYSDNPQNNLSSDTSQYADSVTPHTDKAFNDVKNEISEIRKRSSTLPPYIPNNPPQRRYVKDYKFKSNNKSDLLVTPQEHMSTTSVLSSARFTVPSNTNIFNPTPSAINVNTYDNKIVYDFELPQKLYKKCGCEFSNICCIHDLETKYVELETIMNNQIQERKYKIFSNVATTILSKRTYVLNNIEPLTRTKFEAPIEIAGRADLVGQYVGHTCEKTRKLLTTTLESGKVLFLDEAYSLVIDDRDSFGHEALNELNRFMSEHPELVVIFAGYKDKLDNTLFKYQPGFKRRCTWIFEIQTYTPEMLSSIFKKQLENLNWSYDGPDSKLNGFFAKNKDNFKAFGGDTLRFTLYCKLKYSELSFSGEELKSKTINHKILCNAYETIYCKNNNDKEDHVMNSTMYL